MDGKGWKRNGREGAGGGDEKKGLLMRKGAKHRVGCTVRVEKTRGAAEERGDGHGGKIRGRAGQTEGEGTEKRERHSYCWWWGFRVRPPSTASWNKQTAVRQTVLFLMGEKLAVPWMFPCTFHFLNAVLSVHHLTSHQCLRKEPRFICCCT